MSKFHDEFFKKGSAKHDKLVEQTIAFIEDIFKNCILPEINSTNWPVRTTTVYVCEKQPCFCILNNERTAAFKEPQPCVENRTKCKYCDYSKFDRHNEYLTYRDYGTYNKHQHCVSAQVYAVSAFTKMVNIEPEKICKNGNFIIGYADIKATFKVEYPLDCKISDNFIWKQYDTDTLFVDVVVECKPDLSTWGGPLRQVKTYMDIIRCNTERDIYNDREERRNEKRIVIGLFTTYSVLPEKIKELLKKENIFAATLPREDFDE